MNHINLKHIDARMHTNDIVKHVSKHFEQTTVWTSHLTPVEGSVAQQSLCVAASAMRADEAKQTETDRRYDHKRCVCVCVKLLNVILIPF